MTDDHTPPTQFDADEFDLHTPPKWPKVVGIISIVWALLGLTCGGLGMASPILMGGLLSSQLDGAPLPPTMVLTPMDYVLGVFGLALAVLLFIGGIQTIIRRPIGRAMHLVYGLGAIPSIIYSTVSSFSKQEATKQWAQDYPDNPMAESINAGGPDQTIGMIIGLVIILFFMTYPLFCVIWFGLIKTKHEQMTGGAEDMY